MVTVPPPHTSVTGDRPKSLACGWGTAALLAGSDGRAQHWACLASLIETAKLNGIDPLAHLSDILTRLAQGHPINRIAELLPWRWTPQTSTV